MIDGMPAGLRDCVIVSPVTYQGAKTRLAAEIVSLWLGKHEGPFHDLCCGSGAISIEMVNRGVSPSQIVMIDAGPWGIVWQQIGAGTFNIDSFRYYTTLIPHDLSLVKGFMKELSRQPAHVDTAEVFLLLQAASFGGKAIWISDDKWCNTTFRSYWLPTTTSSRRSPVNPMMPMPDTILKRLDAVMPAMLGVSGACQDVGAIEISRGFAYIDPPYGGTTGYGHNLDAPALFRRLGQSVPCYISEGFRLSDTAAQISSGREKGGISGDRQVAPNQEWVSWLI